MVRQHRCLICVKKKQAAYLSRLMSVVKLYLLLAPWPLFFHFFFWVFPLTQSLHRNRNITILLTPEILRNSELHVLVFYKPTLIYYSALQSFWI